MLLAKDKQLHIAGVLYKKYKNKTY